MGSRKGTSVTYQSARLSQGKHLCDCFGLRTELATFFVNHHFDLKEQLTGKLDFQTWIFGRDFLEKEQSELVTSREANPTVSGANIWAFKQKSQFWKTFIRPSELVNFPIHKGFSGEIGAFTNKCNIV